MSALNIGTYKMRSQVLRGYVRRPRPASPGSTTKVEACHPRVQLSGEPLDLAGPKPSLLVHATVPTPAGQPGFPGAAGRRRTVGIRMPPWALAVAETHPRGLTGRVGAGQRPGLPRDEARFSSRRLGRNPPSGTQSLDKTPLGNRMVARSEKNWMIFCGARPELDGAPEQPVNGGGRAQETRCPPLARRTATATAPVSGRGPSAGDTLPATGAADRERQRAGQRPGTERRKLAATGAADTRGDPVNSRTAKATSPRYPTNQVAHF